MNEQEQLPKTIKFGECELDVPSGIVTDGDRSTRLDPKSVDVAIYLATRAGQLVTHDQLLEMVWPNKFVSESQLSKRITEIRQALGDKQKPHRYIETLPTRGYRLVCRCEIVKDHAARDQTPDVKISSALTATGMEDPPSETHPVEIEKSTSSGGIARYPSLITAIGMLVIALGYIVYASLFADKPTTSGLQLTTAITDKSVAVLPFVDLSPDGDWQWYSNGLSEEIINNLSQLSELRVIARTSSFQFINENIGITEIAGKLGVSYLVEGSVRRDGDRLRITAKLIRATDGIQMWSEIYTGSSEEIFDVQENVAKGVAATLNVYLDEERRQMMIQVGTRHAEAYEAYLQGMDIWSKWHTGPRSPNTPSLWDGNVFFKRAMELDPGFAAAALMHSDAFTHVVLDGNDSPQLKGGNNPMHSPEVAQSLQMKDLDLAISNARNPSLKSGMELQREFFSSNWTSIPRIVERLRGQTDSYPWRQSRDGWLTMILNFLGEYEMSRELMEARLRADPLDSRGLAYLARIERFSGNLDLSRKLISRAAIIQGNRNLPNLFERRVAISEGSPAEVIRSLELAIERGTSNPFLPAYLAAVQGKYKEANRRATEATSGSLTGASVIWLWIYHETGDSKRSRELTQRIDLMPGGSVMFAEVMVIYGNSLFFDLADAPNFITRLQQASIDPASLKRMPRLSAIGEARK